MQRQCVIWQNNIIDYCLGLLEYFRIVIVHITYNERKMQEKSLRILRTSNYGAVKIWWTPQAIYEWFKTAPVYRLTPEEERQYGISE